MTEKEFNLLHEPWIRVMREDCQVEEASLPDALLRAHEYRSLAGELPTQNAAILRLLLAVLHAVFERVDMSGENAEIEDSDEALERWEELWNNGRFPEVPLEAYFAAQEDNFWLFHPTKPFWQIPEIPNGVLKQSEPVQKLNGSISESANKARLFAERCGEDKSKLTNEELARWLVCMNQYDDNTLKTGLGVALLGQFVAVIAVGDNLFETLMLNFVLCDQRGEAWPEIGEASWEKNIHFHESVRKIAYPEDPVAILSYHSRYGMLVRNNGELDCYQSPKVGICYDQISQNEQMSLWKRDKKKEELFMIRSMNGHQAWREFDTVFTDRDTQSTLIRWHNILAQGGRIPRNIMMRYAFVEIVYDKSQHSSVDNIFSDTLSLHANLLTEVGESYRMRITEMVARCDSIAQSVSQLAADLYLASGGDVEKKGEPETAAKERYYFAIDVPFRQWLATLDAGDTKEVRETKMTEWCEKSADIARKMAEKMVQDAGRPAYIGKSVSVSKEKKEYYSSSLAMQRFKSRMRSINN